MSLSTMIDKFILLFTLLSQLLIGVEACGPARPLCRGNMVWTAYGCQCPVAGQVWNGVACRCPPHMQEIAGGGCRDPCPGGRWNGISCQYNCKDGFIWDQSRRACVARCKDGFRWAGGKCLSNCRSGYKWDKTTRKCIPICPPNQGYDGKKCVSCPPHQKFNEAKKACVNRCTGTQNFDGHRCVTCQDHMKWDPTAKKCVTKCPDHMNLPHWDGRKCVGWCKPHERWNQAKRRCLPRCQDKKKPNWDGGKCVGPCKAPERWNLQIRKCEYPCPPHQVYNTKTKKCTDRCPKGQAWNPGTKSCKIMPCPTGQTRDAQGNCVPDKPPCPAGFHRDSTGKCIEDLCPDGFERKNGKCEPKCVPPSRWDAANKRCTTSQCPEGLYWSTSAGKCIECGPGEKWFSITGSKTIDGQCRSAGCTDPKKPFWDGRACVSCALPKRWYNRKRICVTECPEPSHWSGQLCVVCAEDEDWIRIADHPHKAGECHKRCQPPEVWSSAAKRCVKRINDCFGPNRMYDHHTKKCITCKDDESFKVVCSNGSCRTTCIKRCQPPEVWSTAAKRCVKRIDDCIGPNRHMDPHTKKCITCKDEEEFKVFCGNGWCRGTCYPRCRPPQQWDKTKKACTEGTPHCKDPTPHWAGPGKGCVKCKDDEVFHPYWGNGKLLGGACVPHCHPPTHWDPTTKSCKGPDPCKDCDCPHGSFWSKTKKFCVTCPLCSPKWNPEKEACEGCGKPGKCDDCTKCPDGSNKDASGHCVVCKSNEFWCNSNKRCLVRKCKADEEVDPTTKRCVPRRKPPGGDGDGDSLPGYDPATALGCNCC